MSDTPAMPALLDLAVSRFENISPAEQKLFEATEKGQRADCREDNGEKGVIRSELLAWLCTDPGAAARVTYRGVLVVGAEIDGLVNLEWAKISFPLQVWRSDFKETVNLRFCHFIALSLTGSSSKKLRADGLVVDQNVFLAGFKAQEGVELRGARIGGDLICAGGQFTGERGGAALDADSAKIKGNVFLCDDERKSQIGGRLIRMIESQRSAPPQEFPDLLPVEIQVTRESNHFIAQGEVIFRAATIGGNLRCDGGEFVCPSGETALNANSAKIQGHVYLRGGFNAQGGVDLTAAKIGGSLACENGAKLVGEFIDGIEKRPAISAVFAKIDGNVSFRATAEAETGLTVDFRHAQIGGNFQWQEIASHEKTRLDLRFAKVGLLLNEEKSWPSKGNLKLDGFVYDQFDDHAANAKVQLSWLRLQREFSSQPYE